MTRILFLAANPKDTPRTRLDEEIRTIEKRIRLADLRDLFDVKQEWALRATDFQRTLMQHKPEVVHFAGIGTPSGEIILEDEHGRKMPVSAKGVSELFSILKDDIQCVIINACHSKTQAHAIARHVDYVIGWSNAVSDRAAITFVAAFYQALGFGRTIKTAFALARNQLTLEKLDRGALPILLSRNNGATSDKRMVKRRRPRHLNVDSFVSSERFVKGLATGDSNRIDMLNSVVLSRLSDGGSSKRSETARQLGYLRDPAAVSILEIRWPLEPDPTVRYWLAIALGWIGGERGSRALVRLQRMEKDPFTQSGIKEALKNTSTMRSFSQNERRIVS